METIKTLWYIRKVRIYEGLVRKMTLAREKIKAKQSKYQAKAVKYKELANKNINI